MILAHKGFVLLNCDLGAEEYVIDEIKKISNVTNAYLTFGAYDVIANVCADDQVSFERTVAEIRRLSRVVSTVTLNILESGVQ